MWFPLVVFLEYSYIHIQGTHFVIYLYRIKEGNQARGWSECSCWKKFPCILRFLGYWNIDDSHEFRLTAEKCLQTSLDWLSTRRISFCIIARLARKKIAWINLCVIFLAEGWYCLDMVSPRWWVAIAFRRILSEDARKFSRENSAIKFQWSRTDLKVHSYYYGVSLNCSVVGKSGSKRCSIRFIGLNGIDC